MFFPSKYTWVRYDCCFGINTGHCQQYRLVDQNFQTGLCAWYCIIHFFTLMVLKNIHMTHICVHMFHIVYLCRAHFSHARIGVERKLSKVWVEKDTNTDAPPLTNILLLLYKYWWTLHYKYVSSSLSRQIFGGQHHLSSPRCKVYLFKQTDTFQNSRHNKDLKTPRHISGLSTNVSNLHN